MDKIVVLLPEPAMASMTQFCPLLRFSRMIFCSSDISTIPFIMFVFII